MTGRLRRLISIGAALVAAPITLVAARPAFTLANPASSAGSRHDGIHAARSLSTLGRVSRYAFVELETAAHSEPEPGAPVVGQLSPITFWTTSTVVLALAQTAGAEGERWTEVRLSELPNNVVGWVPSSTLGPLHTVHTWLKIDLERLTATLIRNGRAAFRAPIGVGQPRWPTPTGQFFVEESLTPPEPNGLYGSLAFGTSAHSAVLTEWPNEGQIGIHGTNQPHLIPGRVSHGCIRLRNHDILRLGRLMPVGTPITIS